MSFATEAEKPRSEKVILVKIESELLVKIFTDEGDDVYSRDSEHFVKSVKLDGQKLIESPDLGSIELGEYYYSYLEKKVYISIATSPSIRDISLVLEHHYSNASVILPYDLSSGNEVEWDGRIVSIGSVGQSLDEQNTGVVVESKSSISLQNTDGYFDNIFDTQIWENKLVTFYAWFPSTSPTDAVKIFEGLIESKSFSDTEIKFSISDFTYRFKSDLNLSLFSVLDKGSYGQVPEDIVGLPKRRIYGQADRVRAYPCDNYGSSVVIELDAETSAGSPLLEFVDLDIYYIAEVGDEIEIFNSDGESFKSRIKFFNSFFPMLVIMEEDYTEAITVTSVVLYKNIPNEKFNRKFNLSGSKNFDIITPITSILGATRFLVEDISNFRPNDKLLVAGQQTTVRRVSGNELVLNTVLSPPPSLGDNILRPCVQNVYSDGVEYVFQRDWDYSNDSSGTEVFFTEEAELNITKEQLMPFSVTFDNSDNVIDVSSVDATAHFKVGDWIRKNSIVSGENDYYRIKRVEPDRIFINIPFAGTDETIDVYKKEVKYINDESVVTVDCYGADYEGSWIRTPAQAVRHICLTDSLIESVDEESFAEADADCDYTLSFIAPESYKGQTIKSRDAINQINESVFGSLYGDSVSNVKYSILNASRRRPYKELRDDDILDFSTTSDTEIFNSVELSYAPRTDSAGNEYYRIVSETSDFVNNHIGISQALKKKCYIYDEEDARTMAQRWLLFKSMTNTSVSVTAKMNLFLSSLNDRIYLSLDRIYKRFAGYGKGKFGIVSSVKRSFSEVTISIQDMGNIFNRVACIADDEAPDFSSASNDEKIVSGYIVDDDTLTPDIASEENLGSNIIG